MTQGRKKRQLIDGGSQGGGIAPSAILGGGKPLQIYAGVMCRTRFQGTGQSKAVSLFPTENMNGQLYKNLCAISKNNATTCKEVSLLCKRCSVVQEPAFDTKSVTDDPLEKRNQQTARGERDITLDSQRGERVI